MVYQSSRKVCCHELESWRDSFSNCQPPAKSRSRLRLAGRRVEECDKDDERETADDRGADESEDALVVFDRDKVVNDDESDVVNGGVDRSCMREE